MVLGSWKDSDPCITEVEDAKKAGQVEIIA